jgi:ubiquinone/menaquinone biosynthesis C-methylase UbiE
VLGEQYCGLGGQLSYVRRWEVERCVALIKKEPSHLAQVLDVGCGAGGFTMHFARFAKRAVGVDTSDTAIAVARNRAENAGIENATFLAGSFNHLPFSDDSFTTVIALDSIQHAHPFSEAAQELFRVMKVGGSLVFTNWLRQAPLERLVCADPLYTALIDVGFRIVSIEDTDPGLVGQIKIYVALAEHRQDIEREMGSDLFQMFMADAKHLAAKRPNIQRGLTIAVKL